MGKRGADKELTQNNWQENEDESNSEGGSGEFKKASGSQLEGRKIRGMPKRKGAATQSSGAPAVEKPSAFGGTFAASSNPFAALSTPSSSTTSAPPLSANTFGSFGTTPAAPEPPKAASNGTTSFSFGSTTPSFGASTSASSTPAASAGFSFGGPPAAKSTPSSTATSHSTSAFKYYTSLRGLNVSLSDSLAKELEKNPFSDLGKVLEKLKVKYEDHRAKIQKEFDSSSGSDKQVEQKGKDKEMEVDGDRPTPPTIPSIFTTPPASSAAPEPKKVEEKKSDVPALPTAPAVFSFAGSTFKPSASNPPASSSAPPPSGGFVLKSDAPADPYAEKSSFKFPVAPTPAPSTPSTTTPAPSSSSAAPSKPSTSPITAPSAPKLAPAKLTNPPAKPSPLRFGQSVSPPSSPAANEPEKKKDESAKPKSGFSFGATFGSIAKGDDGKSKKDESEKKEGEKKTEAPKTGGFSFTPSTSASTPAPSSGFTFGSATAPSSTSTPAKGGFTFGGATPFSTPANASTSKAAPSPPIATSFGSSSPPQFSFGAALQPKEKEKSMFGGSKATGFGFGSSIGGTSAATPSSGFSFGQPAKSTEGGEEKKPATSTGFAFGSSGSSSTPSTGFSFGSTSTTAPASNGFAFSAAKPVEAATSTPTSTEASPAPEASTSDSSSTNQTPGANPFSAPGAGEEGETARHTVRGKVWSLKDGAHDLGVANISVKEREEDGKKKFRLLARNEVNGAVLMNFSLYPNFAPKVEKAFITFLGFDAEGKPMQYRIRVKTKEMVEELEQKLQEAVKELS